MSDWREDLERRLIAAGTQGIKHTILIKQIQAKASAEDITKHLEALWAENKVDKFTLSPPIGRPATIWRATSKILR